MEVLADSRAWIEASTGHVWDKGGNESRRCPFDLELELIQAGSTDLRVFKFSTVITLFS
jgi:hypothetical protein